MQKVLTAEQMREIDRLTTERYGIPSLLLMENAANAVARVITEKLGGSVEGRSVLVLCGKGNNGGDGAAIGRLLDLGGADVEIVLLGKREDTKGDAMQNFDVARELVNVFNEIVNIEEWKAWFDKAEKRWDVVVDAIFGTGLSRPIEGYLAEVVNDILMDNVEGRYEGNRLAVSVDLPSGTIADRPNDAGPVLEADITVTFTAPKAANVLPFSHHLGGELIVAEIGSGYELVEEQPSQLFLGTRLDALYWLNSTGFTFDSYKNRRGHALVIAGSEDYSGAAVLAANAAMRSGVGLVTLACPAEAKPQIASRLLPEVILRTIEDSESEDLVSQADAITIGCGLDANDTAIEALVRKIVEQRTTPVIVDAGALWFFNPPAGIPSTMDGLPPLILTPHEGEFLRLLGTDDKDAIADRVAAVRNFSQKNNVILVLKGERVLIGEPGGKVVVNPTGNAGLGKAGNGDTLTGILAGSAAQAGKMGIDVFETVVAAVYIAGMAGDIAEKKYGKRVMTASDVRECLSDVFAQFEVTD